MAQGTEEAKRTRRKDGLYLARRKSTGVWYVKGAYLGVQAGRTAAGYSTLTRDRKAAEGLLKKREREIHDEVVHEKPKPRTFAHAAIGYMKGGGERELLAPILKACVEVDGQQRIFGEMLLDECADQVVVDALALTLYPHAKDSTRARKVYTPVSYVLRWASRQRSWKFAFGGLQRPKQPKGRLDWRRPAEIEWWIERLREADERAYEWRQHVRRKALAKGLPAHDDLDAAGSLADIFICYVGTGCRASELIGLDAINVSPERRSFTLWDDETKSETTRTVHLQPRVREAMPARTEGKVWRNSKGEPWHGYDALNNTFRKISEAEALRRAPPAEREAIIALRSLGASEARGKRKPPVGEDEKKAARLAARARLTRLIEDTRTPSIHLHVLRHTWATWAYAVTQDLSWVIEHGGWASEKLALRYIHTGTRDLKTEVLAYGWTMRADSDEGSDLLLAQPQRPALPAPQSARPPRRRS